MDVVDGVTLPGQGVDEHPGPGGDCRLSDLGHTGRGDSLVGLTPNHCAFPPTLPPRPLHYPLPKIRKKAATHCFAKKNTDAKFSPVNL